VGRVLQRARRPHRSPRAPGCGRWARHRRPSIAFDCRTIPEKKAARDNGTCRAAGMFDAFREGRQTSGSRRKLADEFEYHREGWTRARNYKEAGTVGRSRPGKPRHVISATERPEVVWCDIISRRPNAGIFCFFAARDHRADTVFTVWRAHGPSSSGARIFANQRRACMPGRAACVKMDFALLSERHDAAR